MSCGCCVVNLLMAHESRWKFLSSVSISDETIYFTFIYVVCIYYSYLAHLGVQCSVVFF